MLNRLKNALWLIVAGVVAVWAVTSLVGLVRAGPMEPPYNPASTMKTLDEIPPSWHQKLAADDTGVPCNSSRFKCVMDDQAVLDKETGLVWERAPSSDTTTWGNGNCVGKEIGSRYGWRVPTAEELMTLGYAPSNTRPALPPGNPFTNVPTTVQYYWSATTDVADSTWAFAVNFGSNDSSPPYHPDDMLDLKTYTHRLWCVRGGQGYDAP
jgi:hypothetical protein